MEAEKVQRKEKKRRHKSLSFSRVKLKNCHYFLSKLNNSLSRRNA